MLSPEQLQAVLEVVRPLVESGALHHVVELQQQNTMSLVLSLSPNDPRIAEELARVQLLHGALNYYAGLIEAPEPEHDY